MGKSQTLANGCFRVTKKDLEKTRKVVAEAAKKSVDARTHEYHEEDGPIVFKFERLDWDVLKTLLPFEGASFKGGKVATYDRVSLLDQPCVLCGGSLIYMGDPLPSDFQNFEVSPCKSSVLTCLSCGLMYSMPPRDLSTPRRAL